MLPTQDGKHTQYYENTTNKFREFIIYNGELVGPFLQYNRNGLLLILAHFNEGRLDGDYLEYYDDQDTSLKKISGSFNNDLPYKKFETYYISGNLCTITNFDKNGKKHGDVYEFYDENLTCVKLHLNYNHGEKHGKIIRYYRDGKLDVTANYENGYLNGEYTKYFPTGIIRIQCYWRKGKLDGKYIMNYPNGNPLRIIFFKEGLLNGRAHFMHKDCTIKTTCDFVDGKLSGEYKNFDTNGIIIKYYIDNKLLSAPEV